MLQPHNNPVTKRILIILFLFISLISLSSAQVVHKVHVTIKNSLGTGFDLTTHCRSTEDDIGVHVLENGQTLSWPFRCNYWGTTKFRCILQSKYFDVDYLVYGYQRDNVLCSHECIYVVNPHSICLQLRKGEDQRCLPLISGQSMHV